MSILTESLERILNWFQQNAPSDTSYLQPGLTHSEIEKAVETLPFLLPTEFYELYQWRNGSYPEQEDDWEEGIFLHPGYCFNSLEVGLRQYEQLLEEAEELAEEEWLDPAEIWSKNWFPICSFDRDYLFIIGQEQKRRFSPVMGRFRGNGESLMYSSITNMMLIVAECYETGVYYLDEDNLISIDEGQQELVRYKYERVEK